MLIDQLPPDSHLASLSQTLPDGVLEPELFSAVFVFSADQDDLVDRLW